MGYSSTNISFLDVSITKKTVTNLSTDLFIKNTDSHQYVHATLCHPSYRKKSIIYGQVIRFKRIFSVSNKLKKRLSNLVIGW